MLPKFYSRYWFPQIASNGVSLYLGTEYIQAISFPMYLWRHSKKLSYASKHVNFCSWSLTDFFPFRLLYHLGINVIEFFGTNCCNCLWVNESANGIQLLDHHEILLYTIMLSILPIFSLICMLFSGFKSANR